MMTPTPANGKICYIELPAADVERSAEFYSRVFGWRIRKRGDGSTAFDDTTGQVSGSFIRGRQPAGSPGLLVYIMVDSAAATWHRSRPTEGKSCSRSAVTPPRSPPVSATRAATSSASTRNPPDTI